jgi:hypothetical protein
MVVPSLRDDLIKQMKAENTQVIFSEASFAGGESGKNSFGKRNSSRILNVSNTTVDERFFEKHEYHAVAPEQKNMLRLKRLEHVHVGNGHGGNGNGGNCNGTGKSDQEGP